MDVENHRKRYRCVPLSWMGLLLWDGRVTEEMEISCGFWRRVVMAIGAGIDEVECMVKI